jgi:FAD/FMN-containing dehydrogenase
MEKTQIEEIKKIIKGDVLDDNDTLTSHSNDASLFEIRPELVIFPKDSDDVKAIVRYVENHKKDNPTLSITARSGGTCMSGGSINESIILDFTKYMNRIIEVTDMHAVVEPGCYYRDMDHATLEKNRIMPAYTASKDICAVGGMLANNAGGEKAIKYGKVENFIEKLKVVFTDGNEYEVRPMNKAELTQKIAEDTFEGRMYKNLLDLINQNKKEITEAKPNVSKNSAGYYLWNIVDENENFDLCKLIVGSQGTLGIVTEITWKLVPTEPFSNLLAVFMPDISQLSNIVTEIVPFKPDSLETYDDYSMELAVKFFFDFFKSLGFWGAIKLGLKFIPEAWMILTHGVPKLILLVEVTGQNQKDVKDKLTTIQNKIEHFGYKMHIAKDQAEADKYWRIRRESFNMLRKHVHNQRTAPFIDDIIVKPEYLPEFLPKVRALIDKYKLVYTIAGHAGNGNFHIIPLMDLDSPFSADTILELSKKVYDLVHDYDGSITAEHNDGIIRTPYLTQMFGEKMVEVFQKTKNIFDPQNILNPGKKVGGTFEDIRKYIKKKN